jgi:hypothetical protein
MVHTKRAGYIVSKAPENSFICQALRMRKGEKSGEKHGSGLVCTSPQWRGLTCCVLQHHGLDPQVEPVGQETGWPHVPRVSLELE